MKKTISLLLSFVMIFSITAGIDLSAYAASRGFVPYAQKVNFDTSYTDYASPDAPYSGYANSYWQFNCYQFTVPVKGMITIYFKSENANYFNYRFSLYNSQDIEYEICRERFETYSYNANEAVYYSAIDIPLSAGTYFLNYEFVNDDLWGSYDIMLKYKVAISKPSTLKVSTRNTTTLKLGWSKVSGASGYELQQKSGDTYKTKKTTTSTSYTVSNLSAGKNYSFRVRAYKTVSGKKYYSGWKYLTTCAKPKTASLSKLTAYKSGHKIKATWKKVGGTASGYQIYWAKDKSFKKIVAKTTVSGQSKTSYTGKNFTKGKKYYVKIRAYKTVNGTKYYGAWSNTKSITAK